jgi:hypothetical protein
MGPICLPNRSSTVPLGTHRGSSSLTFSSGGHSLPARRPLPTRRPTVCESNIGNRNSDGSSINMVPIKVVRDKMNAGAVHQQQHQNGSEASNGNGNGGNGTGLLKALPPPKAPSHTALATTTSTNGASDHSSSTNGRNGATSPSSSSPFTSSPSAASPSAASSSPFAGFGGGNGSGGAPGGFSMPRSLTESDFDDSIPLDTDFDWSDEKGYSKGKRTVQIWSFVLRLRAAIYLLDAKWSYPGGFSDAKRSARARGVAVWTRECLLRLGPTFIKLGQVRRCALAARSSSGLLSFKASLKTRTFS